MTGIVGRFDDSQDDDVLGVSGYVSDAKYWDESFTPVWRAFLRGMPHGQLRSVNSNQRTAAAAAVLLGNSSP
jgi:hypothetical protein